MKYIHEYMDDSLMDEMEILWSLHWNEVANFQENIKLAVDRESYIQMQQVGLYQTIVIRNDENTLIGYIGFIISTHPHYKDNIFASMDNVFIHREYRKGFAGIRLFKEAEKLLKELGVDMIMMRTKKHFDLSPIFERMGYLEMEKVYSKYIGVENGN